MTEHVHGSDPEHCDRCWDVVIDQRRPSIEELIERSSLGTPEAKRYRAMVDPETARRIVEKAFGNDQEGQ